jgi:ABC-2 type transport system permease protein
MAIVLRSIAGRTLRDQRKAFTWWTTGLLALALYLMLLYPSLRDNDSYRQAVQSLPESLRALVAGGNQDPTTAAGYLNQQLFGLLAPLLALAYAISAGARSIAGEEERGTLDLLLAHPVGRVRVVLEKAAAMLGGTLLIGLVLWGGLAAGAAVVGMDVGLWPLAAASLATVLLGLAGGALALAVGAAVGHRTVAIGAATAVLVATYLVNSLAGLVTGLEPWRKLSPFWLAYSGDPLRAGLDPTHTAILLAISLALVLAGATAFTRRDLAT